MRSLFVFVSVCTLVAARHRLGEHVNAAKNTHLTIEELLDAVFSVMSLSCKILNM
jgi:SUMO ligase MMS21 Smc5/6 complex component